MLFNGGCSRPNSMGGAYLPAAPLLYAQCGFFSFPVFWFVTTQQIHSLRASGVMSSQAFSASGAEARAFRKSDGILCAVPLARIFVFI